MKRLLLSISSLGLIAVPTLAACTSLSADPCSKAGIEARIGSSLRQFARNNRSDLNEVKKAASYLDGESTFGAMKLAFAVSALKRVADEFEADIVPEINAITQQCESSEPLKDVFVDFLKDEGLNSKVIKWVEAFRFTFETDAPA